MYVRARARACVCVLNVACKPVCATNIKPPGKID